MKTIEELNQMLLRIQTAPEGTSVLSEHLWLKEALKELEELRARPVFDVDAVRDRLFEGVTKEQAKQHQRTRRLIKKLSPARVVQLAEPKKCQETPRCSTCGCDAPLIYPTCGPCAARTKNWHETLQAELDAAGREVSTLRVRLEGAIEGGKALKHQLDQLRLEKGTSDREKRLETDVREYRRTIRILTRQLNGARKKLGLPRLTERQR